MTDRLFTLVAGLALATALTFAPHAGCAAGTVGSGAPQTANTPRTGTLGGLWRSVKAREDELAAVIGRRDLAKVHERAFALRDLVVAMPARSAALTPGERAKLENHVTYVRTLAARLGAAGDAKGQGATETAFRQLRAVLTAIEALYPPAALAE